MSIDSTVIFAWYLEGRSSSHYAWIGCRAPSTNRTHAFCHWSTGSPFWHAARPSTPAAPMDLLLLLPWVPGQVHIQFHSKGIRCNRWQIQVPFCPQSLWLCTLLFFLTTCLVDLQWPQEQHQMRKQLSSIDCFTRSPLWSLDNKF